MQRFSTRRRTRARSQNDQSGRSAIFSFVAAIRRKQAGQNAKFCNRAFLRLQAMPDGTRAAPLRVPQPPMGATLASNGSSSSLGAYMRSCATPTLNGVMSGATSGATTTHFPASSSPSNVAALFSSYQTAAAAASTTSLPNMQPPSLGRRLQPPCVASSSATPAVRAICRRRQRRHVAAATTPRAAASAAAARRVYRRGALSNAAHPRRGLEFAEVGECRGEAERCLCDRSSACEFVAGKSCFLQSAIAAARFCCCING